MGILIFGAGVLIGIFLGMALFYLMSTAQEAERVYDWLEPRGQMATPADTYCAPPLETILLTSDGEELQPREQA